MKTNFLWEQKGNVLVAILRQVVETKDGKEFPEIERREFDLGRIPADVRELAFSYGIKKVLQDRASDLKGKDALTAYADSFEDLTHSFYKTRAKGSGKIDTFRLAFAIHLKKKSEGDPKDLIVIQTWLSRKAPDEVKALYVLLANEGWVGKADLEIAAIEEIEI